MQRNQLRPQEIISILDTGWDRDEVDTSVGDEVGDGPCLRRDVETLFLDFEPARTIAYVGGGIGDLFEVGKGWPL